MTNYYTKQRFIAKKMLEPILKETASTMQSGIYLWQRIDEFGITYFYIGQAHNIYERQIGHLNGYQQHIDLSIRKRKFKTENNPYGWAFSIVEYCNIEDLDERENYYILQHLQAGEQTLNKTYGSQGQGKVSMDGRKPPKTYRDGVSQGYENARREVAKLFKTYLKAEINGAQGVRAQNALQKFEDFIKGAEK